MTKKQRLAFALFAGIMGLLYGALQGLLFKESLSHSVAADNLLIYQLLLSNSLWLALLLGHFAIRAKL